VLEPSDPAAPERPLAVVLFAGFVATVIAANWLLSTFGVVALLGLGPAVPAGVYAAGLAFGLRDALHETAGRRWVLTAIAVGAAVSYVIEDAATIPGGHAAIAVASAVAFGVSELADLAVYEPLRCRSWPVCRRQSTSEIATICSTLAARGIQLHGFGVKTLGLRYYGRHLASADSMAWSYNARRNPPMPGHRHQSCANCLPWALHWRDRALRPAPFEQLDLWETPDA
jgi:hypothetical protein